MNLEHSGPLRIEGRGEFPTNKIWNVHGAYHVELTYPGDIQLTVSDKLPNGIKFIGDEGWIFCTRESESAVTSRRSRYCEIEPKAAGCQRSAAARPGGA